jgi:hypothetical protein
MVRSSTSAEIDALGLELIAMSAVAKELGLLDPEARIRVLRWANEHFQPPPATPGPAVANSAQVAADALLFPPEANFTGAGLDGMFDEHASPRPALHIAPETDLTVDDVDEMFDEPAAPSPAEVAEDEVAMSLATEDLSDVYDSCSESARPQLHLVPREELPFDQIVDDFVDSCRRLTRDWQDV